MAGRAARLDAGSVSATRSCLAASAAGIHDRLHCVTADAREWNGVPVAAARTPAASSRTFDCPAAEAGRVARPQHAEVTRNLAESP
jgi:hypothetical protein